MNTTENSKDFAVVLAPGAADASEGLVLLNGGLAPGGHGIVGEAYARGEMQSAKGYWSLAPGCGDVSEGMIRVADRQDNQASGRNQDYLVDTMMSATV